MIKSLKVEKLFGRYDYDLEFFEDVNIITGSNGVGKTTLLKLMWYIVSGNLRQALKEIPFSRVEVVNANVLYSLKKRNNLPSDRRIDGSLIRDGEVVEILVKLIDPVTEIISGVVSMSELENELAELVGPVPYVQTLFFPTFRRFGTGFKLETSGMNTAMQGLVNSATQSDYHILVASANRNDLKTIYGLMRGGISDRTEPLELKMKNELHELAKDSEGITQDKLHKILDSYQPQIDKLQAPLRKLNELIDYLFLDKSIEIMESVMIGTHPRRVSIEHLSSGEEAMLAFLLYNMAYNNAIFFIDEPELYFHPDWQRLIMGILQEQNSSNSFIVVTHSPSVATSMPSRLIRLDRILRTQIPEAFDVPEQR